MWAWLATPVGGDDSLIELTAARDRKVTWRLRDQSEASVTLTSGSDPDQSQLIEELRSDLIVTWNGRGLWRGRFGPSTDSIDETTHQVTFGAIDYRGVLARRFTHEAIDLDAIDLIEAGWRLIDHTQRGTGLPGGPLGIGKPVVPTVGDPQDVDYPVGKEIAEAITELSTRYPGFDWWIDPDMLYRATSWRGSTIQRDFPLLAGTTVTGVERTFDPTSYANTIIQTGTEDLDAAIVAAADLGTDARREGRWEAVEANPDLATQPAVDDTATTNLHRRGAFPISYKLRLRPGAWTPDDLWLGDLARIRVRSGRLDVDTAERVIEITVTDSPDGPPEVDITVGNTLAADLAAMLRRLPARLSQLARR